VLDMPRGVISDDGGGGSGARASTLRPSLEPMKAPRQTLLHANGVIFRGLTTTALD